MCCFDQYQQKDRHSLRVDIHIYADELNHYGFTRENKYRAFYCKYMSVIRKAVYLKRL